MVTNTLQLVLEPNGARLAAVADTQVRLLARLGQFVPLTVAAAAVAYFGCAYAPAVTTYYRAQRQASTFVQQDSGDARQAVKDLVQQLHAATGLWVEPRDIKIRRAGNRIKTVQFDLKVPVAFPFVNAGRALHLAIVADRHPTQE